MAPSKLSLHEPDGKLRQSLLFAGRTCNSITFAANSKTLACLWSDRPNPFPRLLPLFSYGLSLLDASTLKETKLVSGKDKPIDQVMFGIISPDGRLAAANTSIQKDGVPDGTCVFVWQTSDSSIVKRFDLKLPRYHGEGLWSVDGKSVTWKLREGVSERSFHLGDWLLGPGLKEKDIRGGSILPLLRKENPLLQQGELSVRYDPGSARLQDHERQDSPGGIQGICADVPWNRPAYRTT